MTEKTTGRTVIRVLAIMAGTAVSVVVLFFAGFYGVRFFAGDSTEEVEPTPTATETRSTEFAPMVAPVPANSDCKACHGTDFIRQPNIPRMAHPAEGWSNCTTCHNDTGLVKTAPGHTGIHKEACLMCHQPADASAVDALPRPHHVVDGQACTTCHTAGGKAPLPSAMAERSNCWVCHTGKDSQQLFKDN